VAVMGKRGVKATVNGVKDGVKGVGKAAGRMRWNSTSSTSSSSSVNSGGGGGAGEREGDEEEGFDSYYADTFGDDGTSMQLKTFKDLHLYVEPTDMALQDSIAKYVEDTTVADKGRTMTLLGGEEQQSPGASAATTTLDSDLLGLLDPVPVPTATAATKRLDEQDFFDNGSGSGKSSSGSSGFDNQNPTFEEASVSFTDGNGFAEDGFAEDGFAEDGFAEDGFAEDGFVEAKERNRTNHKQQSSTNNGFDEGFVGSGFDGFNENGFNENGDDGFDNCNPEFSTQSRPAKTVHSTVHSNLNSDLLDLF
jgi:hypothetical protein